MTATVDRKKKSAGPVAPLSWRIGRRAVVRRLVLVRLLRRVTAGVAALVLWQLAVSAGWVPAGAVASPVDVIAELYRNDSLLRDIAVSFRRAMIGLMIGGLIATVLGLVSGLSSLGEELIEPPLQMYRALPFLGLLPLLIGWVGIGEELKITLVVLAVVFPIYLNLSRGIRMIDSRLYELAAAQGLGRISLITEVVLPGALGSYLVGIRLSLGLAWLSLSVSETVNADSGIGAFLTEGKTDSNSAMIMAGLVIYAVLGIAMEFCVRVLEKWLIPWRRDFSANHTGTRNSNG